MTDAGKKRGMLVEDETVVGGRDEHGAPVVETKDSEGKAPRNVTPTDKREKADDNA